MSKDLHQNVSTTIQALSALVLGAGFIGFLVENIYLSQFGFWDFNFLHAQYVTAGILFLLFVSVPSITFILLREVEYAIQKRSFKYKLVKTCWVWFARGLAVMGTYFLSFFLFLITTRFSMQLMLQHFLTGVTIFWAVIVVAELLGAQSLYSKFSAFRENPASLRNIVEHWGSLFNTPLMFVGALILVVTFSLGIYPAIPHSLGGGKPTEVKIFWDSSKLKTTDLGLQNPQDAMLLYQSPDYILTLTPVGVVSTFRQDEISSIQYPSANIAYLRMLLGVTQN